MRGPGAGDRVARIAFSDRRPAGNQKVAPRWGGSGLLRNSTQDGGIRGILGSGDIMPEAAEYRVGFVDSQGRVIWATERLTFDEGSQLADELRATRPVLLPPGHRSNPLRESSTRSVP